MAGIYGFIHLWMRGIAIDLVRAMPLLMGALFVVIGGVDADPPPWKAGPSS